MDIQNYIKPELLVLIPVLYFIGYMMKEAKRIDDRCIPAVLGTVGILLSILYMFGSEGFSAIGIFTAITQGILVAGAAVYSNQLIKQALKED